MQTMLNARAVFSVVATPIGNLEDITMRALRVLKEADLILCEDTRVTRNLLQKYAIATPTMSYHARSKPAKVEMILGMLADTAATGMVTKTTKTAVKKIALVSDAGTPGISDPGALLVSKIREGFAADIASGEIRIEAIPGPSALIAALSIAGVPCADFAFLGFLPHKKGRETLFKEMAANASGTEAHAFPDRTSVFYESPHRIMKALESLASHMPSSTIVIARELTKIFEEIIRGRPADVSLFFKNNPDKVRGEFVVIVVPNREVRSKGKIKSE